jgi:sulfonate transport system substrate-binding protein
MFSFGPTVNEALVSGAIDIGFVGDMPSVSLAAVDAPITVISRQSVFRGTIIAATKSDIKTLADLKGKKVHGPVGSSIYLASLAMLEKVGLKPGSDVEIINMGLQTSPTPSVPARSTQPLSEIRGSRISSKRDLLES